MERHWRDAHRPQRKRCGRWAFSFSRECVGANAKPGGSAFKTQPGGAVNAVTYEGVLANWEANQ